MVLGDRGVASQSLPSTGVVVIGRGDGCDVVIDDASVSRRHAQLHLGATPQLEDLRSANGTFHSGARLAAHAPTPLRFGEVVHIGAVPVILQQHAPAAPADDAAAPGVIVVDPAMRAVHATIDRIAEGDLVHRIRDRINDLARLVADRCVAAPRATTSSPSSRRLALDDDPRHLVDATSDAVH